MNRWKRKHQNRRGAAAVEFAVVIPAFLAIVFGIVEFGRAFNVLGILNTAARNGARQGCLNGSNNTKISSAVTTTTSGAGINGVTTTVLVNGVAADANTAKSGDTITVTVTVPTANVSWMPHPWFLKTQTLQSTCVMRRE